MRDEDINQAPMPSSFDEDEDFFNENRARKLVRRLKEEPLVPLGCALTCWALYQASKSMRAGDHARTNVYFRRRVYAQGFTLAAVAAGGMYWKGDREKRKEWERLQKVKEAQEKRERWLRELEFRDEEEKRMRAARAKAKAGVRRDVGGEERRGRMEDAGGRGDQVGRLSDGRAGPDSGSDPNSISASEVTSAHREIRSVLEQIEMRDRIGASSLLRAAWDYLR